MRLLLLPLLVLGALAPRGQAQTLNRADSVLVGRLLLAEDRRDSTDGAFAAGLAHADPRVRAIAVRGLGRIRDPQFAARAEAPAVPQAPLWVEPPWRLRFRQLTALRDDCAALRIAVMDSAWAVRLRAADLARASCAGDDALVGTFRRWVDALPPATPSRARGDVSWQAAAHGIVALARLRPAEARSRLPELLTHRQWQVRRYAVQAAAVLEDTAAIRRMTDDAHDNVAESAIEALHARTGHADDARYLAALRRDGAQVVRAAALALAGSPRPDVAPAALRAFERIVAREDASAHDARVALLAAAGRPATEDRPPTEPVTLPRHAVALALGDTIVLRVTMAATAGGGTFDVRLRGDVAPMMAARLLALADAGYYDGLTWHRVEPDFVIQGGSPGANEYVGARVMLRDELGTLSHRRGTLGMSTRGHDTGDAQWFVNLKDNARLDRDYTVWGEIVAGIDVVDGILEGDAIRRIRRLEP
ncbi:MAG: hypothetical protein RL139_341 [Gemmatimonadota bacterium]|jgi:cyclophilin family peptidyl-prolyl cis-trans isomerase